MKIVNKSNSNEITPSPTENMVSFEFNMQIYNELNDQTQFSVNVLALINEQFKQITEMNKRRSLLLKEVASYIVK